MWYDSPDLILLFRTWDGVQRWERNGYAVVFNTLHNLAALERPSRTTAAEYFMKKCENRKKQRCEKSGQVGTSRGRVVWRTRVSFWKREWKEKGSGTWDRKQERACTAHKLGGTKLHFFAQWQVINEKNRRKYDNMTEHKGSSCCGWTQR